MFEYVNLVLLKAEDPEAYKKLAERGVMVAFPATVAGQTHRPDIGIAYHSTVKFFNPDKDSTNTIHGIASKLQLVPPDPKHTKIEPGVLKDRAGNDIYVIKLHGPHADQIKDHNSKFAHLGYPQNYTYQPHVSVDKKTWDRIVASKAQTAHEAGIHFGPAELRQGHNVLATYGDQEEHMAASEKLEKGFVTHLGTALGIAAATASSSDPSYRQPEEYSSKKMLNAISQVESSGGKQTKHKELGGMHTGERAYGKYGLTPTIIRETINLNRDLAGKFPKATQLHGDDLHHYMQDNPGLEETVAQRHLSRLEHHFGKDPASIGYAWLQGVRGTYKAKNQKQNIHDHWHVKKIKQAYARGK